MGSRGGRAIRYGVGVGRQGFGWSGIATIHDKQEWPDWYPPKEMIQRQPELMKVMSELQSGIGMHGGPRNPLGARAMYLWQGNKDTLFRIHGTVEPWTIGKSVSSGCIRMINQEPGRHRPLDGAAHGPGGRISQARRFRGDHHRLERRNVVGKRISNERHAMSKAQRRAPRATDVRHESIGRAVQASTGSGFART
jgi:hypothetical protein